MLNPSLFQAIFLLLTWLFCSCVLFPHFVERKYVNMLNNKETAKHVLRTSHELLQERMLSAFTDVFDSHSSIPPETITEITEQVRNTVTAAVRGQLGGLVKGINGAVETIEQDATEQFEQVEAGQAVNPMQLYLQDKMMKAVEDKPYLSLLLPMLQHGGNGVNHSQQMTNSHGGDF